MSSGGMDWAYRMISLHGLDISEIAVILHLGWRDHPDLRTDRGIARALGLQRRTVQRVTLRLQARGCIDRRAEQWVAVETIRIVEETRDGPDPVGFSGGVFLPQTDPNGPSLARQMAFFARRPKKVSGPATDGSPPATHGSPTDGATQGRPPGDPAPEKRRRRVAPMRIENKEKDALRSGVAFSASNRPPVEVGERTRVQRPAPDPVLLSQLSAFQRERLRTGQSFVLNDGVVLPGSPIFLSLGEALRAGG